MLARMNYRIAPIPQDFLDRVRTRGIDDLGQPVRRMVSVDGGEPCRDALRRAQPGEEIILASFSPFTVVGPYCEFGPVYVFAQPQDDGVARDCLPQATDYLDERFAVRAYDHGENIADAALVTRDEAEVQVQRFLADEAVAFVHARFPTHGCFALRVDRAS